MEEEFGDGRTYFSRVPFGGETEEEISRISEYLVFANGFINFYNDQVRFPNGHESQFLRLETPGRRDGTVVVAVNDRDEIAVVKQFRYAPRLWTIELPRGFCGPGDISGFLTGWREFTEEVGGQLREEHTWSLGRVLPDSGKLFDAPFAILSKLARPEGATPHLRHDPDVTEAIAHKKGGRWIGYLTLRDWIERGLILDMFTCAIFARLRPHFDGAGRFEPDLDLLRTERFQRAALDLK